MEKELENDYETPEETAEDVDAGSEPQDGDADDAENAYREFMASPATIRYEDTEDNRSKLFDFLAKYEPSLPETPAALYLAFDELRKDGTLELIPLAPEKSPDMRTAGEAKQAEDAERAKQPEPPTQNEIAKDASAMSKMFKRQSGMVRYKNGRKIGAQTG